MKYTAFSGGKKKTEIVEHVVENSVSIYVDYIHKMQSLAGTGMPVSRVGRTLAAG
jgi:hypothetical protein